MLPLTRLGGTTAVSSVFSRKQRGIVQAASPARSPRRGTIANSCEFCGFADRRMNALALSPHCLFRLAGTVNLSCHPEQSRRSLIISGRSARGNKCGHVAA